MVFLGARGIVRTPARGRFHCPHCDAARTYAHRRVRRMLVFLNVPVVPRGDEVEYVQCGFCRHAFAPSVLESARGPARGEHDDTLDWHYAELTGAAATTLLTWRERDE